MCGSLKDFLNHLRDKRTPADLLHMVPLSTVSPDELLEKFNVAECQCIVDNVMKGANIYAERRFLKVVSYLFPSQNLTVVKGMKFSSKSELELRCNEV